MEEPRQDALGGPGVKIFSYPNLDLDLLLFSGQSFHPTSLYTIYRGLCGLTVNLGLSLELFVRT